MRSMLVTIASAVVLATMPAVAAESAPGPRSAPRPRVFDSATVTTVSGEVAAVRHVGGRRGAGVHVDLRTADGVLDVHLGPSSFLEKEHLAIAKGDALEVTGSKVTVGGRPALIAQSVKKGAATVTLRDAQGNPAWSRRGR